LQTVRLAVQIAWERSFASAISTRQTHTAAEVGVHRSVLGRSQVCAALVIPADCAARHLG
jgi:hypothetical protein